MKYITITFILEFFEIMIVSEIANLINVKSVQYYNQHMTDINISELVVFQY